MHLTDVVLIASFWWVFDGHNRVSSEWDSTDKTRHFW